MKPDPKDEEIKRLRAEVRRLQLKLAEAEKMQAITDSMASSWQNIAEAAI